jgi:hypothetical protein
MFTPEGDLRPGFEPEESAPEVPPPPGRPAPKVAAPSATTEAPPPAVEPDAAASTEPRTEFARIVSSLATTAYSALGLLSDSASGAQHRDLGVARQMIDWLAVLEQKTRGNLSFEESDLLSRVLYELRLAYVEVGRGSTK